MASNLSPDQEFLSRIVQQPFLQQEDSLQQLRKKAQENFLQLQFPSKKDEDWQFIDLADLKKYQYEIAQPFQVKAQDITSFYLEESNSSRLVCFNGVYQPYLSSNPIAGVYVGNLSGLTPNKKEKLIDYVNQGQAKPDYFTALNYSGLSDLAIVWVEPDVEVKNPVQLFFLTSPNSSPNLVQPHILIVVEKNSKLQLLESYHCLDQDKDNIYWTNSVSQIFLAENSGLEHTRLQDESLSSFSTAKTSVFQKRNSQYKILEINLGAQLSRHDLHVTQLGEMTQTSLIGLVQARGEQTIDIHTKVDLNYPNGIVEQLQKCILSDRSNVVFNGKIIVPQAAQMTNANQLNRNLLLSSGAKVNSKPELQITADNVKCSHGATVSQLEEDEIFYLRSRGLTLSHCKHLLVEAFAAEIINQISLSSLKQKLFALIQ
jgi:Fe-S cluster assembly protein SufD